MPVSFLPSWVDEDECNDEKGQHVELEVVGEDDEQDERLGASARVGPLEASLTNDTH